MESGRHAFSNGVVTHRPRATKRLKAIHARGESSKGTLRLLWPFISIPGVAASARRHDYLVAPLGTLTLAELGVQAPSVNSSKSGETKGKCVRSSEIIGVIHE